MSMSDPIADLLTRIRNAHMRNLPTVIAPSSKLKKAIVALLKEEGYIEGFSEDVKGAHATLNIQLKYYNGKPVLERLQRVSRPGLRIYKSANDLFAVKNGLGEAIVSTSRGVMTARKAKAAGVGGELLCIVS